MRKYICRNLKGLYFLEMRKKCRLIKSLYGLKKATTQWHEKFDKVILSNDFIHNGADVHIF